MWPVFVCAAAIQGFNSIDSPARSAVIPAIVDRDSLVAANALTQLLWQLSSMVGPAIAGLLIATTHGNIALVYWIDVASTAVALLSVARLPALPPSGGGRKFSLSSIAEGFSFLAGRQVIQGSLLADWLATVLGEPVSLFPYMALVRFHGGPTAFGILTAAPAIGAALGSLLSGWAVRVRRPGRAVLYALVAWGIAITSFRGVAMVLARSGSGRRGRMGGRCLRPVPHYHRAARGARPASGTAVRDPGRGGG